MVAVDMILLPFCITIAILLRLGNLDFPSLHGITYYAVTVLLTILVFSATGIYGAIIRHIDLHLLTATGIGLAVAVIFTYLFLSILKYDGMPNSILMIYWFITLSYVVTSRLLARSLLRNWHAGRQSRSEPLTAVYGAGEAGVKLVQAMRISDKYRPVCFFDDKQTLDNRNVAGLKVFHSTRLVDVVSKRHIGLIVIAIPSATPEQRKQILCRAQEAGVTVRTLCSLMEINDENISAHSIRDIKLEDLLGREPIRPLEDLFAKCVRGQGVLVSGAGGSIGSELCRQIIGLAPRQLHILDHSEYALYSIHQELLRYPGRIDIRAHLGSACDPKLVARIMEDSKIDTVYHAAAYKHVPLLEENMAEGVRNNILGAQTITDAARMHGVKTCVLISTDKAVRPTSIMGASKRIAELIFQAAAIKSSANKTAGTKFCTVRFGNVLGSSGSVVPLFKSQIEQGGPITITHPEVVRYFMSIPEAAQLVIQAGAMASGGDVFVMDMGKPVKIIDLAHTMLAMCGLTEKDAENPNGDIEIRVIGLRPGEKLYEELFAGNDAIPSKHPRIMTTKEYAVDPEELAQQVAYLMLACATNDKPMIRFLLQKLVTGYVPSTQQKTAPQAEEGSHARAAIARSLRVFAGDG